MSGFGLLPVVGKYEDVEIAKGAKSNIRERRQVHDHLGHDHSHLGEFLRGYQLGGNDFDSHSS